MQERVKPRTRITLEIDAALALTAGAKGLDLALLLERAIHAAMREGQSVELTEADRAAIEAHNRYTAAHGTLAESLRGL